MLSTFFSFLNKQWFIPLWQQSDTSTQNVLMALVILCLVGIGILIWRLSSLVGTLREAQSAATEAKQSERQLRSTLQIYQAEKNELVMRQKLTDRLITLSRATSGMSTLNDTLKNILRVSSLLTNSEIGSLLLIDAAKRRWNMSWMKGWPVGSSATTKRR